jgi:hypothetical protein
VASSVRSRKDGNGDMRVGGAVPKYETKLKLGRKMDGR